MPAARSSTRGETGRRRRIEFDEIALDVPADELLTLDEALAQLTTRYPECGELVKLRFFGGLTLAEAELLSWE